MHQYYCKDTDYLFIIFAALILFLAALLALIQSKEKTIPKNESSKNNKI